MSSNLETATLAGGCFWYTEAIFQRLKGVVSVKPGYAGGTVFHPSYEQVSSGSTGHAEAIQLTFDPSVIKYATLLDIFWHTHNPTTLNQQGHDYGPQYRSVIFYHSPSQQAVALNSKAAFEAEHHYSDSVVTEIVPFTNFFVAEDYHQNYYNAHADSAYCSATIDPKIEKLMNNYGSEIKPKYQLIRESSPADN